MKDGKFSRARGETWREEDEGKSEWKEKLRKTRSKGIGQFMTNRCWRKMKLMKWLRRQTTGTWRGEGRQSLAELLQMASCCCGCGLLPNSACVRECERGFHDQCTTYSQLCSLIFSSKQHSVKCWPHYLQCRKAPSILQKHKARQQFVCCWVSTDCKVHCDRLNKYLPSPTMSCIRNQHHCVLILATDTHEMQERTC